MKNNQKLKGKDLINIGIYAAIYCVLMTCISMLGYIPIMMPMLTLREKKSWLMASSKICKKRLTVSPSMCGVR